MDRKGEKKEREKLVEWSKKMLIMPLSFSILSSEKR